MDRQNALELASRGISLMINYFISVAAAEKVVFEIEAHGSKASAVKMDVSQPTGIVCLFEKIVEHYGHLDTNGFETFDMRVSEGSLRSR